MIRVTNSKFQNKGFTLIEMLIVISIIGILASIILVGLGAFRSRGRDTRRIADLRQTQGALELYYAKFERYPSGGWDVMNQAILSGGVGVNKISNDPLSSRTYEYGVSSDGQQYVLKAVLEDAGHPSLNDDVDNSDLPIGIGVNCDDSQQSPNYCISL